MEQRSHSSTSSSRLSSVPSGRPPLKGAAFFGKDGCEHQEFMQTVKVMHGTGLDAGRVDIQIGDCYISVNSREALILELDRRGARPASVKVAG